MTNRTKEFFDFAQLEPLRISDMAEQITPMSDSERDHVLQVAHNVIEACCESANNKSGNPPIIPTQ